MKTQNLPSHFIEPLENRIAPAVFLVSSTGLTIKNLTTNAAASGDADAQTVTGANFALLLGKGDSVMFDTNGDAKSSKGDVKLLSVTSGRAMAFFTDTNASGQFDLTEFTGLALGERVNEKNVRENAGVAVTADVRGAIAMALDDSGDFVTNAGKVVIQDNDLIGLKITGRVIGGDILAGGSISKLTVANAPGSRPSQISIDGVIAAGTAVSGLSESFNGGGKMLTVNAFAASEFGANVTDVKLVNGVRGIFAGNGASASSLSGFDGGVVRNVTISNLPLGTDLKIQSGAGGATTDLSGSDNTFGGFGGDIENVSVSSTAAGLGAIEFQAGAGGSAAGTNFGGSGGDVRKLTVKLPGDVESFTVNAGAGGGNGGDGGDLDGIKATVGYAVTGGVEVFAGDGNSTGQGGGFGGDAKNLSLTLSGTDAGGINVGAGHGGNGAGAFGGTGGTLSKLAIATLGHVEGNVLITGGDGGNATDFFAGDGGDVTTVTFTNSGTIGGFASVIAGFGGSAVTNGGAGGGGGNGGHTSGVTVKNTGRIGDGLGVYGGDAGNASGLGSGGVGGDVSKVVVNNLGNISASQNTSVNIESGGGGNASTATGAEGDGGDSGNVTGVTYNDNFGSRSATQGTVFIVANSGGNGSGALGFGGTQGSISLITLNAPRTLFALNQGPNPVSTSAVPHGGDGPLKGGDGGDVTDIKGSVAAIAIQAGDAGDGTDSGVVGADGGDGGDVKNINVKAAEFIQAVKAGNGGNGDGTGIGGLGGSITNVKTNGDIGDFESAFNVRDFNFGMGGLVAGEGGNGSILGVNGSVKDVSAARIAAIIAGRPAANGITEFNAVASISGIRAGVIGADLNNDRFFGFIEGGTKAGFQPSSNDPNADGDTAIDGLVIVEAGKFTKPPVTPLKLIEIA